MNPADKKQRSTVQLRRFFGVIKAAFDNWPDLHTFRPDNEEHLRAWLLVKSKHRSIKAFDVGADAADVARMVPLIAATMLEKYCWAWPDGDGQIKVCAPLSIKFASLPHEDFCKLCDEVEAVILAETGMEAEHLLKAKEAA